MSSPLEVYIRYRSFVGMVALVAVLYLSTPSAVSIGIGFFFIVFGMAFRAWSAGYIFKNEELATSGPYELTRNPLYFGSFLLGVGIAVGGNNIYSYLIFVVYYFSFFPFLMYIEHKRLKKKFGKKYEDWYKKSNTFFPKIKKVKKFNFNISYYMKNKEYKGLYFSFFVIAVYILKVLNLHTILFN
jgi:protein-S-isoprenylcysteine O-methyltransferase Ste14